MQSPSGPKVKDPPGGGGDPTPGGSLRSQKRPKIDQKTYSTKETYKKNPRGGESQRGGGGITGSLWYPRPQAIPALEDPGPPEGVDQSSHSATSRSQNGRQVRFSPTTDFSSRRARKFQSSHLTAPLPSTHSFPAVQPPHLKAQQVVGQVDSCTAGK